MVPLLAWLMTGLGLALAFVTASLAWRQQKLARMRQRAAQGPWLVTEARRISGHSGGITGDWEFHLSAGAHLTVHVVGCMDDWEALALNGLPFETPVALEAAFPPNVASRLQCTLLRAWHRRVAAECDNDIKAAMAKFPGLSEKLAKAKKYKEN